MNEFIPQQGYYRNLRAYQLAEIIYDITFAFTQKYFTRGDRTIDQMVQAARSGKQNIAEGSAAGSTSKETEIKLTNVAKASLQELLIDYEDYLRVRGLEQWPKEDIRVAQTRNFCNHERNSANIMKKLPERSDETIANIAITLIHQTDRLLYKLIERQKQDFLRNGGIREQMSRARREYRSTMRSERPMSTGNTGNTERLGPYNQSSSHSSHSSHSSPYHK
ncbi:MAG: four helix bundle suffix domain-containing protein [Muribaculaceae bacterium]|nr:four helix bundle suffix domain-containing protein [Muribaculaceae bacterium]